ncbi:hypothetical protein ABW20_dc0104040 [Dactylellina cionopaga]|nr:hypothetical protein ABW20_dc0104040 [Dactylellina cionopaga]
MPWVPEWYLDAHGDSSDRAEYLDYKRAREALGYASEGVQAVKAREIKSLAHCRSRYELLHWHDHIRVLQTWWNEGSRNDTWWTELLNQLSIFTRPENWYRWNIQRPYPGVKLGKLSPVCRLAARFHEEPIHVAAELGLHLLIDHLVQQPSASGVAQSLLESQPRRESDIEEFGASRVKSILRLLDDYRGQPMFNLKFNFKRALENISPQEAIAVLNTVLKQRPHPLGIRLFLPVIEAMDPSLRILWLASQEVKISDPATDQQINDKTEPAEPLKIDATLKPKSEYSNMNIEKSIASIYEAFTAKVDGSNITAEVANLLRQNEWDNKRVTEKLHEFISSKTSLKTWEGSICSKPDPFGYLPLYIAAKSPVTVDTLIRHRADVNAFQVVSSTFENPENDTAHLSTLFDISALDSNESPADLLTSAKALIAAGARLDVKSDVSTSVLHLAAKIRDLKFFKLLVVSFDWDVHAVDIFEKTPLHYLFGDPAPKNADKAQEVLDICQVIMKMRRVDGGDLINAEDDSSEMPLSGAVRGGFKQAVDLLISLGANIKDENDIGQNYFHVLADGKRVGEETGVAIASMFFDAGLDYTKPDSDSLATPIFLAAASSKRKLAEFFLQKYEELAKGSESGPILHRDVSGSSLIDYFTRWSGKFEEGAFCTEPFLKVVSIFRSCGGIGEFISQTNSMVETPLHLAIRYRRQGIAKHILDLNPDMKVRNIHGYNPLDAISEQVAKEWLAVSRGKYDINPKFQLSSDGMCQVTVNPKVLGCGFNPLEYKVFFTADGKVVPFFWTVPQRRYFPHFYSPKGIEDYKFNFGSEPFMFKLANNADWQWAGSFHGVDISDVEVYWQSKKE